MAKQPSKNTEPQTGSKRGFTRRGFLKASVATTAAAGGVTALTLKLLSGKAGVASAASASPSAAALDIWNLPAFTPASGPYKPDSTWKSLTSQYKFPTWYRNAKYGIWAHWSPQSVPEYGDWYALHMYNQGTAQYNYHLAHYGHPSKFGYKDITHLFTGSAWNPTSLLKLYVQQGGAKYFMGLANHHDNYDNWDSTYQPWNSTTVGRKSSIIGEWAAATRAQGIHFGVTYHACPGPAWGFFLPARYGHDHSGAYAGVTYDGVMTAAQGKGLWWNGLNPQDLNGTVHTGPGYHPKDTDPFTRQFYWRVDDLITKYKPDILYFDDSIVTTSTGTATDWSITNQSYVIAANYYNKSLTWHSGAISVVTNFKGVPGNALAAVAADWEKTIAPTTQAYPWQAENSLGPWHYYAPAPITMSSKTLINNISTTTSRNGNYLINVPQHGDGHLDQSAINIVTTVGTWLKANGLAIYDTRPFGVSEEPLQRASSTGGGGASASAATAKVAASSAAAAGATPFSKSVTKNVEPEEEPDHARVVYTRNGSTIYAIALSLPADNTLTLTALKKGSPYLGNVLGVKLLGTAGIHDFTHAEHGLTIHGIGSVPEDLAYAFEITHDRLLVNNDDEGVEYAGMEWIHEVNREVGNTNNNVHITTNNGDSVSHTFTGTGIEYITELHSSHGEIAAYIDGVLHKTVNAYSLMHQTQVTLHSIQDLPYGEHTITLVKVSGERMIVDAFKVS